MDFYNNFVALNDYPMQDEISCTANQGCPTKYLCDDATCARQTTYSCGEVKDAYKSSECCGAPQKSFVPPNSRRLLQTKLASIKSFGDVRMAYRSNGCCGAPEKAI